MKFSFFWKLVETNVNIEADCQEEERGGGGVNLGCQPDNNLYFFFDNFPFLMWLLVFEVTGENLQMDAICQF